MGEVTWRMLAVGEYPARESKVDNWGECCRHAPRPLANGVLSATRESALIGTVFDGAIQLTPEDLDLGENEDWHEAYDRSTRWPVTSSHDWCGEHQQAEREVEEVTED
jgi:hypothetical protein